ncbi:MAG: methyltransferase domain-containing protein [Acidimicrobiales bacterium]|nr:methyltransferase domain-containing protein [Acidimicrobiales bacterium]
MSSRSAWSCSWGLTESLYRAGGPGGTEIAGSRIGSVNDTYTHGHHSSVLKSHTWRTAQNSAGYLLAHLSPALSLLDVGCGPATISCDLATRVGHVLGIDTAEGILDTAEATKVERGADNVEFRLGDVYRLEFEDNSFDVVHAHQVLQHLSDPVTALKEMVRVAKPGGLVAVRDADYHAMSWYPEPAGLDLWMDVYQRVARRNDAEPDAARHLLRWTAEAGIERDRVEASVGTWLYCTEAERLWWGALWAERSVSSAFGTQAREYAIATEEDLAVIVEGWKEWMTDPSAWFVVPNGELLIRV